MRCEIEILNFGFKNFKDFWPVTRKALRNQTFDQEPKL